jgi:tetratricopeptide (TPR) repeat protein
MGLDALASAEALSGDLNAAERDYRKALRIAQAIDDREGVATYTCNLAALAFDREDWLSAEALAREALLLAEKLGRMELIAANHLCIAKSLVWQGQKPEALPHARRAIEIYTDLRHPDLEEARETLAECES